MHVISVLFYGDFMIVMQYEEEDSLLTDTATLPSQKEGKDSGLGQDSDRPNELSDQVCTGPYII